MCPPNIVDFAEPLSRKAARTGRAWRFAGRATALEWRARWHWWAMEHSDAQVSKHSKAIARIQRSTVALKTEMDQDELVAPLLGGA